MLVGKYNSEGYPDPTPYLALNKEKRWFRAFRPIVYICSPYSGAVEANTRKARSYCRFAVEQGYIPIAPHLLFPQFLDDNDEAERKLGLFFGTAIMSRCSEIWVFGDKPTHGMRSEIKRAVWKNYRIRFFTEDMKEVKK